MALSLTQAALGFHTQVTKGDMEPSTEETIDILDLDGLDGGEWGQKPILPEFSCSTPSAAINAFIHPQAFTLLEV